MYFHILINESAKNFATKFRCKVLRRSVNVSQSQSAYTLENVLKTAELQWNVQAGSKAHTHPRDRQRYV